MAHSAAIRLAVRDAYIAGSTLAAAAERAGVSEVTARAWKKAAIGPDDWDRLRAAKSLVSGGHGEAVQAILGDFLQLHGEAIKNIRDSGTPAEEQVKLLASLTDSLSKTMSALGRAAPRLSELGIALEVLCLLGDYVKANHPKLTTTLMTIIEPFGVELGKKYGLRSSHARNFRLDWPNTPPNIAARSKPRWKGFPLILRCRLVARNAP